MRETPDSDKPRILQVLVAWAPVPIVLFLVAKVVPSFAEVFASFGKELPWPTRIVVAFAGSIQIWHLKIPAVLSVWAVLGLLFFVEFRTKGLVSRNLWKFVALGILMFAALVIALFLPMFFLGG